MENQSCTVIKPQTKTEILCRPSGFIGSEIEKCVWCVYVLPLHFVLTHHGMMTCLISSGLQVLLKRWEKPSAERMKCCWCECWAGCVAVGLRGESSPAELWRWFRIAQCERQMSVLKVRTWTVRTFILYLQRTNKRVEVSCSYSFLGNPGFLGEIWHDNWAGKKHCSSSTFIHLFILLVKTAKNGFLSVCLKNQLLKGIRGLLGAY